MKFKNIEEVMQLSYAMDKFAEDIKGFIDKTPICEFDDGYNAGINAVLRHIERFRKIENI